MSKSGANSDPRRTAKQLLAGAYSLRTPDDNLAYYHNFAAHYDDQFVDVLGYRYPQLVANEWLRQQGSRPLEGAICDIGCGTGLVAIGLLAMRPELTIDGADISPQMLAKAREKRLYRALYEVDLCASPLALPRDYAALVSAGAFTHGHLDLPPLTTLIGHCRAGALAIIGVNARHYAALGFAAHLNALAQQRLITAPTVSEVRIYSAPNAAVSDPDALLAAERNINERAEHANDNACLVGFTVC